MAEVPRHRQSLMVLVAIAILIAAAGCPKQPRDKPMQSRPAEAVATPPSPAASRPANGPTPTPGPTTPTTQPVTSPPVKTQPAQVLPASTYESRPPYPVKLYVRSPRAAQPGWLKILELAADQQLAVAEGEFPRQNDIHVDTQNVQRIRIHIGHLPLRQGKLIMLRIDKQPIELRLSKGREFITMERTPAGVWRIQKTKPKPRGR